MLQKKHPERRNLTGQRVIITPSSPHHIIYFFFYHISFITSRHTHTHIIADPIGEIVPNKETALSFLSTFNDDDEGTRTRKKGIIMFKREE
jgi:hypothetical protein